MKDRFYQCLESGFNFGRAELLFSLPAGSPFYSLKFLVLNKDTLLCVYHSQMNSHSKWKS